MSQKYKFFIKDKSVTFAFTGDLEHPSGAIVRYAQNASELKEAARIIAQEISTDIYVDVKPGLELEKVLYQVQPVVVAAGGFVLNPAGALLMIHRRGFWDLPKGKTEAGESLEQTAVREVEEECGVDGLSIASRSFLTHHIYREKGVLTTKQCVWYQMNCDNNRIPTPQTEEDIAQACWVAETGVDALLDAAYPSIQDVIHHFRGGS